MKTGKSRYNVILYVICVIFLPSDFLAESYTQVMVRGLREFTRIVPSFTRSRKENNQTVNDVTFVPANVSTLSSGIQFVFYNRKCSGGINIEDVDSLNATNFDGNVPIKFVMHGWLSSGNLEACQSIKNSYLLYKEANIFIVHWEKISRSLWYILVIRRMELVADYCADFLKILIERKKVDPKNIHLVGHSLGAHMSGMIGRRLMMDNITIGRITGLDPASPGFQFFSQTKKLSSSDARFVVVIHTSSGTFGIPDSIGHVDLFPNGGIAPMPGCEKKMMRDMCSHSRSWQYFAESIVQPFFAVKCETLEFFQNSNCSQELIEFGEDMSTNARGNFYFRTNLEPPFSKGMR